MAESNTFHGNSRLFFLFFFFSGYQGTVHDGMKASGDGVADALVFAPYGKKILPLWKLDRQEISQQNPLRGRHSTTQEMFTFAVAISWEADVLEPWYKPERCPII